MSWIDAYLTSYTTVQSNGAALPQESILDFTTGFSITDDPNNGRTIIAITGTGFTQITGDVLAGPGNGSQAATVVAIQGNTVTSGALVKGDFFIASTTSNWQATALSGDVSASVSTPGLITVIAIQGNAVSSVSPTDGQALIWSGTADSWEPTSVGNLYASGYGQMDNPATLTVATANTFYKFITWTAGAVHSNTTLNTTGITLTNAGIYRITLLGTITTSLYLNDIVDIKLYANGSFINSVGAWSQVYVKSSNQLGNPMVCDCFYSGSASDVISVFGTIEGTSGDTLSMEGTLTVERIA